MTKKPLNCCLRSNLQFKGFLSAKVTFFCFFFYIFVLLFKKCIYGSAKIISPKSTLLPFFIPLDSPILIVPSCSKLHLTVAGVI